MKIESVIENTSNLVYKICYDFLKDPELSLDTVQEVYINLFKSFYRYKDLPENEIKNIICKIAVNKCKDILKNNKYKLIKDSVEIIDNIKYEGDNDIEENIFKKERKKYVQKMINLLKEPYKSLMFDYYINEYSLDEISKKNNTTKGTIKMQIFRGKEKFKKILEENGGDKYL